MKPKDKVNEKITLESLDKKLETIKKEIKKLSKQKENKNLFIATVLVSLGIVLISISISIEL